MKPKQFSKKLNKSQIPAKEPKKRIKKPNEKASGKKLEKSSEKTLGKKLEKIDPELFEYLKQNDKKLLDCEETDIESESDVSENEQHSDDEIASEGELQVEQSDSGDEGSDLDAEDEAGGGEESDDDSESSGDEKVHTLPESLEVRLINGRFRNEILYCNLWNNFDFVLFKVASDESDFEDDDDEQVSSKRTGKVTMNMVNSWENDLQTNK